jgi:hypothetical protein
MAFKFDKITEWVDRGARHTCGTFTNGGADTGGDIYTGLSQVLGMELQLKGSAVVADDPVVNESFPCHDPVTIVTTADADGYWHAFGS